MASSTAPTPARDAFSTPSRQDSPQPEPGSAATGERAHGAARRRRSWPLRGWPLLLVIGYLANVALRMLSSLPLSHPALSYDEIGFMITARALAGGAGGESLQAPEFQRIGYSLLISPAFWFSQDYQVAFRFIQAINALVGAAVLPLAYAIGRRMFRLDRPYAFGVALLAAAIPAAVFHSAQAMSEVPIGVLLMGWLLALHSWQTGGRLISAALAGTCVGLVFLMHVRGGVVLAVHVAVVLLLALNRRVRWPAVALSVTLGVLAYPINQLIAASVSDKLNFAGKVDNSKWVSYLFNPRGLFLDLNAVSNQVWYVVVVTAGLAGVGMVAAVAGALVAARRGGRFSRWLVRRTPTWLRGWLARRAGGRVGRRLRSVAGALSARWEWADPATMVTTATAFVVTMAIMASTAAVLLSLGWLPVNYNIYVRYAHVLTPFWLIVGAAALRLATGPQTRRLAAWTAAVIVFTGAFFAGLLRFMDPRKRDTTYHPFDAPEITLMTGGWTGFRPVLGTVVGLALLAVVCLAMRRAPWRGALLTVLTLVSVAAAPVLSSQIFPKVGEWPTSPVTLASLGVGPQDKVYRTACTPWGPRRRHELEVSWQRVDPFEGKPPADADVVVGCWQRYPDMSWYGTRWGWTFVTGDQGEGWALWRR